MAVSTAKPTTGFTYREISLQDRLREEHDALEVDARHTVAVLSPQRVFIHAGVVGWSVHAIVMPGRTFTGESTLVEALVRRGAEYFSDEYAVLDRKGRFLSGGEQQMLAIARALLTGPELLLLDEPSQGLAPMVVEAVMGTVLELKRERVSMLLAEQNAELALRLADRVYVIDHGTIVFEGTPDVLRADPRITTTYLGVGG